MGVRDLAWGDFPDVVENYLKLYEEVKSHPDLGIILLPAPPSLGEEAEWFARLYRRVLEGATVAVVAEEEGHAVGLCTVDRRGPHRESQHLGVLGILVASGWRGRGIGRALLRSAIDRSRGSFDLIELSVFRSNDRARALYESVGFRSWGILPKGIVRDGRATDVEHMVLELGPKA
ncbi:MAG TPA: GNAT family N-acetyltransferase [Thermoplasmata archaeon]|nr:GNAT family N-acetyltransferase [Thermoplasmata archaeon]